MSFANEWLRYIEKKESVTSIHLNAVKSKDIPSGFIIYDEPADSKIIRQHYNICSELRKGIKLPDNIKVDEEVKSVEIGISKGISFIISKGSSGKPQMKIKRQTLIQNLTEQTLSFEEEQEYVNKAKDLGYDVVEIDEKQI